MSGTWYLVMFNKVEEIGPVTSDRAEIFRRYANLPSWVEVERTEARGADLYTYANVRIGEFVRTPRFWRLFLPHLARVCWARITRLWSRP